MTPVAVQIVTRDPRFPGCNPKVKLLFSRLDLDRSTARKMIQAAVLGRTSCPTKPAYAPKLASLLARFGRLVRVREWVQV